jgi:hypothetical protein
MKFWKQTLITAFAFLGIASTVLYTACTKDSCSDLQCQNGGSCTAGFCHCQTGYEGAECETRSVDRYLGTYYGIITCDSIPGELDTVNVLLGNNLTTVGIVDHKNVTDTIYGTIVATPNNYSISIPTQSSGTYKRAETITLVDSTLTTSVTTVNGNVSSTCTFKGTR